MNTPMTAPHPRARYTDAEPLRFRAELPASAVPRRVTPAPAPMHDFLVPNPRPDLIADVQQRGR